MSWLACEIGTGFNLGTALHVDHRRRYCCPTIFKVSDGHEIGAINSRQIEPHIFSLAACVDRYGRADRTQIARQPVLLSIPHGQVQLDYSGWTIAPKYSTCGHYVDRSHIRSAPVTIATRHVISIDVEAVDWLY